MEVLPEMVPAFVIPPATLPAPKTVTVLTSMPPAPAKIFPVLLLTMLPEKVPTLVRLIVPLSTTAPWMVLSLRTPMPFAVPEMRLVLRNPPVMKVLLVMMTPPPGPIVPALVTPPLKAVALITMVLV
jgi:hypothetical protein